MLYFSTWKTALIIGVVALGFWFASPNLISEDRLAKLPGIFPHGTVNLGLDLQGGSYLLLGVETDEVVERRLQTLLDEVRETLRGSRGGPSRISTSELGLSGDTVSVRINAEEDYDDAYRRLRDLPGAQAGLLAAGGTTPELTVRRADGQRIEVTLSQDGQERMRRQTVEQSIEVVRRRIDELGTREPSIQRQGQERIVVQVPGEDDPERLKELLGRTAQLSFHMVDTSVSWQEAREGRVPPRTKLLETAESSAEPFVLVRERADITGDMLTGASASVSQDTVGWQINFQMNGRGARIFGELTRDNIGRRFAIVLDEVVISAPTIQSAIPGGSGRITGDFTTEEANDLAILLRAGALPARLSPLEQRTVGAELGEDSIRAGSAAAIVGFTAVIVFMVLVYGMYGLFANLALIANMTLIAGALSLLGATLTLPGIAGIVLTIGMAVDANVLIFERIREELRSGKTPFNAVETGYQRAWSAIIDANVTTFFAAFILFFLGAGPVKGFSVTLAIGVFTSVFTAFTFSRLMIATYLHRTKPASIGI